MCVFRLTLPCPFSEDNVSEKGAYSKRKEFARTEQILFFQRSTPFQKGGKNNLTITIPKSVSFSNEFRTFSSCKHKISSVRQDLHTEAVVFALRGGRQTSHRTFN